MTDFHPDRSAEAKHDDPAPLPIFEALRRATEAIAKLPRRPVNGETGATKPAGAFELEAHAPSGVPIW
jgi:hypothetical protein